MKECPTCLRCFPDDVTYCDEDGLALPPTLQLHSLRNKTVVDGRYRLERRIGSGSTGVVYRARHELLGTTHAIKIITSHHAAKDPVVLARFRPSVMAAAAVRHPNLVFVTDWGILDETVPFIVMEFIEGRTLAEILESEKAISLNRAVELITLMANALSTAHKAGLIHGSLTPRKVMLANGKLKADGLKVIGVGLSKLERLASDGRRIRSAFDLTYAAPESAWPDRVEARSDICSLGTIFYQMVEGHPPIDDLDVPTFIRRHADVRFAQPVPKELKEAINHALQNDINARTPSVEEFLKELQATASVAESYSPNALAEVQLEAYKPDVSDADDASFTAVHIASGGVEPPVSQTESKPIYLDDNVQFTVYKPKKVKPAQWYTLLAFAHLSEARPDSNEPDPIEQMQEEAARILGNKKLREYSAATQESAAAIPQRGEITFLPFIEGVEFNPPSQSFFWEESVHSEKFRMRATPTLDGQTVRGRMSVFLGAILLAEMNLRVEVNSVNALDDEHSQPEPEPPARPYRNIFPSYAREDIAIVAQVEDILQLTGDKYWRDVNELRSGQNWKVWMKETIDRADVFQLFWSRNSMRSENVALEWRYALSLRRPYFVRPTFWEDPFPEDPANDLPPAELRDLNFSRIKSVRITTRDRLSASRESERRVSMLRPSDDARQSDSSRRGLAASKDDVRTPKAPRTFEEVLPSLTRLKVERPGMGGIHADLSRPQNRTRDFGGPRTDELKRLFSSSHDVKAGEPEGSGIGFIVLLGVAFVLVGGGLFGIYKLIVWLLFR